MTPEGGGMTPGGDTTPTGGMTPEEHGRTTPGGGGLERHERGGDAAPYLLGALEDEEAAAFERHLAGCVVCRDEVAALIHAVDALPMAAPQYGAPKDLRRRIMRVVRSEPAPAGAPRPRRRPVSRWPVLRPAAAAGLGLVVAAIVAAVVLASGGGHSARVFEARVGHAEVRLSAGRGELIIHHLSAPPPGHIYELWLRRGNGAPLATRTLFSVTSNGTGDVGLPGSMHGIDEVMVTPEPDGGSRVPTGAAVIDLRLA